MGDLFLVIAVLLVLALIGVIAIKVIFPLLVFALIGGLVTLVGWIAYRIYDRGRKRKINQMETELEMQRRHLETVRLLQKRNTELEAQLRDERLKRITETSASTSYMTSSRRLISPCLRKDKSAPTIVVLSPPVPSHPLGN